MESTNTIQVTAFTPEGFRVYVNIELASAGEIDALLLEHGYLARQEGAKVGETIEVMTHVSRRMHTSKKDGSITPVIAFYHENVGMVWKQDHMYFNTTEQITEFETLSGLLFSNIPETDGASFMSRNDNGSERYIIALPHPIKVALAKKPYTKQDGTQGETDKIQRFLDTPAKQKTDYSPPTPSTRMTQGEWNAALMAETKSLYSDEDTQKKILQHAYDNNEISMLMSPNEAADVMRKKLEDIPF